MEVILMITLDVLPTALMNLGIAVTAAASFWMLLAELHRRPLELRQAIRMNMFPTHRLQRAIRRARFVATAPVQDTSMTESYAHKPGLASVISLQRGLRSDLQVEFMASESRPPRAAQLRQSWRGF
jgi:hypothetical protein